MIDISYLSDDEVLALADAAYDRIMAIRSRGNICHPNEFEMSCFIRGNAILEKRESAIFASSSWVEKHYRGNR